MAFGWPTLYKQLSLEQVNGGAEKWDQAVAEASEVGFNFNVFIILCKLKEYHGRVHNLLCDNCHSHVALALNKMKYANRTNWNMLRFGSYFFKSNSQFKAGTYDKLWRKIRWVFNFINCIYLKILSSGLADFSDNIYLHSYFGASLPH